MTATSDAPVRLGSLLFTLVDPERGHEVAYNRWYERDHFYAGCMIGAWQFAGGRFVATAQEKSRVQPGPNPVTREGGRGTYLALYWVLEGRHDEWNRWAVDQVNTLHAAGRMFPHREHVHTALYDRTLVVDRDLDGVPVELALDHRYPGLIALVGRAPEGVEPAATSAWMEDHLPDLMGGSGIAQVLHCGPRPLLADAPGDVPRGEDAGGEFLQLFFCDQPAIGVWEDRIEKIRTAYTGSGAADVLWASPFRPTVVGTDTYADELWLEGNR